MLIHWFPSRLVSRLRRKLRRWQSANIEQLEVRQVLSASTMFPEIESIDGSGNNLLNPDWGTVGTDYIRAGDAEYADGISAPAGDTRPSAREISNVLFAQSEPLVNDRGLAAILWQWGQFLDHDLDLTLSADPAEAFNIAVPTGDEFFDPLGTGTQEIGLNRSIYDTSTGTDASNPRQQINSITAWIDGSQIYGSDEATMMSLRTLSGGRLKTSDGDLLPFTADVTGDTSQPQFFVSGDIRVNEQVALISIQTLWLREHNSWADKFASENPSWSDEQIFQAARRIVIAELQAITYNEFLPALLGPDAMGPYQGYDASVNPTISNEFATAAYRFGHSTLSSELLRLNNDGTVADEGPLALQDAFFNLSAVTDNGIDSILKGLVTQEGQEIDTKMVDDVRNFLFGPPGAGGFDLASLNIQRGRDNGLADYNQLRADYGLARVTSFSQITSDPTLQANLERLYGDVDNIDAWVGILAEDHIPGGSIGQLGTAIIVNQFQRTRAADRFWYQNTFHGEELRMIEQTTLADVMERNTGLTNLQDNVFYEPGVLYYHAPPSGANVTLKVTSDEVLLIDDVINEVVERRAIDDVSRVVLVGAENRPDHIQVQFSTDAAVLPGGISISGENGRGDELIISGTKKHDSLNMSSGQLDLNGQQVTFTGIELIRVALKRKADQMAMHSDPGVPVQMGKQARDKHQNHAPPAPPPAPHGLLGLAPGVLGSGTKNHGKH